MTLDLYEGMPHVFQVKLPDRSCPGQSHLTLTPIDSLERRLRAKKIIFLVFLLDNFRRSFETKSLRRSWMLV